VNFQTHTRKANPGSSAHTNTSERLNSSAHTNTSERLNSGERLNSSEQLSSGERLDTGGGRGSEAAGGLCNIYIKPPSKKNKPKWPLLTINFRYILRVKVFYSGR